MQLYYIRHGQSANNLLWLRTGSSKGRDVDPELTDLGRQQARFLARYLSATRPSEAPNGYDSLNRVGFGITHLYTSLMVRSVATGTIIAQALGLPLVGWSDLHERGGIYVEDEETGQRVGQPGKNRAYFEHVYPELVLPDSLGSDGWWNRPFEEPEQRSARARRFVHDLLERHGQTEDHVAVISHGGFFNDLMAALLLLPTEAGFWFIMNNAAISRIDFADEGTALVYLNRADFLPGELIT